MPWDSRAVIAIFKAADPVLLKIPIPLVLPAAVKSVRVSVAVPRAEVDVVTPDGAELVL